MDGINIVTIDNVSLIDQLTSTAHEEDLLIIIDQKVAKDEKLLSGLKKINRFIQDFDRVAVVVNGDWVDIEDIVAVPTQQEAIDYIQMEQMTRMLD